MRWTRPLPLAQALELLTQAMFGPLGIAHSGPTRSTLFEDDNYAAARNPTA